MNYHLRCPACGPIGVAFETPELIVVRFCPICGERKLSWDWNETHQLEMLSNDQLRERNKHLHRTRAACIVGTLLAGITCAILTRCALSDAQQATSDAQAEASSLRLRMDDAEQRAQALDEEAQQWCDDLDWQRRGIEFVRIRRADQMPVRQPTPLNTWGATWGEGRKRR